MQMVSVVVGLYILPCVAFGVWREGLALSTGPSWVSFLPEDGDRVQSPKCHCKKKK
jgi:hypothetical protein